ncbi:carbamate kinase [Halobellus rarus]|uniref:Carbamate kinase n=1 Tax=Halobellus rarus TaxID=1126237 RepID=A0ABD6CSI5_9EURY|nr:carbamate kinase [Halobellus rarus]
MDGSASDPKAGPIVVALGGNTLLGKDAPWTVDEQLSAIERTARQVTAAVEDGFDVVLTHGNGPQIGNRLLQQENTAETPQLPLDVLVAETQAQIGYLLQQALDNELDGPTDFFTVVTQVVVDDDDPAFENPTKPIGPFYTEAEASEVAFETRRVTTGERPFRRVVPSPEPVEIVEGDEITRLVERGNLVIAAGGGGVPVVRDDGLGGVEAVVDKDKASQLLAAELGAATLVLLTDVEFAYLNYGEPEQRPLREVAGETLRAHLESDEFDEGSMRPKVEACLRFIEQGGDRAVITSPDRFLAALAGETGTQVRA